MAPQTTKVENHTARLAQRDAAAAAAAPTDARQPVGIGTKTSDAVHAHGWLRHRLQPRGGHATPTDRRRQSGGDSAGVRCGRAATTRVALPTGGVISARGGGGRGHNDSERGPGGQGSRDAARQHHVRCFPSHHETAREASGAP